MSSMINGKMNNSDTESLSSDDNVKVSLKKNNDKITKKANKKI
jgi:hypothetical protein